MYDSDGDDQEKGNLSTEMDDLSADPAGVLGMLRLESKLFNQGIAN